MKAWNTVIRDVIVHSFKACRISSSTDGSEDGFPHCRKPGGVAHRDGFLHCLKPGGVAQSDGFLHCLKPGGVAHRDGFLHCLKMMISHSATDVIAIETFTSAVETVMIPLPKTARQSLRQTCEEQDEAMLDEE